MKITFFCAFLMLYASPVLAKPSFTYSPPFIPIEIKIVDGKVDVGANKKFVTPVGVFSVGYSPSFDDEKKFSLIIRDARKNKDLFYEIDAGFELKACIDGHIMIEARENEILVHVDSDSNAHIYLHEKFAECPGNKSEIRDKVNRVDYDSDSSFIYSIQLLATYSKEKAKILKSDMLLEGYNSYIEEIDKGNGKIYRVRVGYFVNKEDAVKEIARMRRRYLKNIYIQSSNVVKNNVGGVEMKSASYKAYNDIYLDQVNKYSLQIMASSSSQLAEDVAKKLRLNEYDAYIVENQSLFKVRIGDSDRREVIENIVVDIKKDFPNALFIKDHFIYTKK